MARFHIANRIPSPVERRFRLSCLSLVLLGCFHQVQANPTLPQVVFGQASFATQGKTLTVTNSPNAIINWNSFSIANGETTRFVQQSASSAVLNRITGQHPSQIFGSLQSNGQVLLINPNGIVFGRGAQVDVRGLVASSLDISNQDFLNGHKRFKASDKAGKVHNAGSLNTANGGQIFLIAPQVENSGIINAPGGQILLAAGRSVQLVDSANPDLHVVVSAPEDQALNLGQIVAQAGKIGIYGALIKQRGSVQADSAVLGEGGKIVLKASRDTLLETGSVTTVRNSLGQGGQIEVLGNRVGMMGDALLDASGLNGGGTVLVGGDYQGQPLVNSVNAAQTWLGPQALIRADATEKGDGGKIVMWGEHSTQAYGSLSARGGLQGGNGGLIETSARNSLDVGGLKVDARSRSGGQNGRWLLDPTDVTVVHGSSGSLTAGMFDPSSSTKIGDSEINAALNSGTDVTIQTSGGTGGTGLITINGNSDANGAVQIVNSSGGARSLSFNTSGTIDFRHGASLSASGSNQLNVNFNASTGINLSGDVDANSGTTKLGAAASFYGSLKNTTLHTPHKMVGGSGVFDQIKLGSDLLSEGSFVIDNGITLDSGVTWDIGQSGLYFGGGSNVYLDSPGAAQVKMAGGFIYAGYQRSGQTLQVGADVSISGHGYIGSSSPSNLKNLGTIKSDLSGHTLTLATTGLDNQGKLQADAGYLTINKTTWSNSGSISVAGGATLSLQFDTTTAGLGTISNNGGTVNYSGTLDNSNAILDIGKGGVFGGLADFSGKLNGGSIKSGDGTALHGTTTLDSVKVLGTLEIQGSTFVSGNLTLADGATLNMKNSGLYFTSSGTPHLATDGKGTLNLDGGYLYGGYNTNDQQVQIDAGVTVQGHGAISNSSQVGFHNLGTIDANVSNHLLTVNPASLINSGTIKATGGSLTLNPISWTNSGVLQVTDGTLTLNLNTTTAAMGKVDRSGGEVHFSGKLDNSNDSLDIGSGGIFGGLSGLSGTVTGGSIFSGDGAALKSNSATLNGVTLSGNLELTGSAFIANNLNLADKAALKLNTGNLYFKDSGSTHLSTSGSAEVELVNGYIMAGYGATGQSLNIAPGVTIRGHGSLGESSEATINLGGTLKVDQSGQTLHVTSHVFNNTGSIQAQGGTLTLNPDSMPQAGTMAIGTGGVINLNFDTTTAALPTITRSGGTVNFNGKLDNSNNTLELGSSGPFGSGGLSSLGGTISGGKIQNTDLNLLQSNSAYLDNVTLAGKLELKGNTFIKQDLLLADGAQIALNNSSLYFVGSDTRHVQSGGSSTLTLDGGNLYAGYGVTGQTLQIGKGVSIEGSGYISNSSPALLVNGGSIHANSKDHTLHLSTKDFQNKGLLKVSDGTLEVQPAGSFSNSGTLQVDGGVLKLDLNTTTANLPNLVRNGGKVYLDGTLDNSNASLDIGGTGPFGAGGLTQLSGVVQDGSILSGDGSKLHASSLTLDNVSLTGQMSMDGNITVLHDLSLAPGANISIDNFGGLYFSSKGTQNLHSTGNATLNFANAYLYTGYGVTGQTVKIGSGITLQGYGQLLQSSKATLENAGLIHANTVDRILRIQADVFNNSGTLKVSEGYLSLEPQTWIDSGSLQQSGGELNLRFATSAANFGNLSRNGGKLNLFGAFENSGQTLDIGAGGIFGAGGVTFFGGIHGGTIKSGDASKLNMAFGVLDGVTLGGELHIEGAAGVVNSLSLAPAANITLSNSGGLHFHGSGTQNLHSSGNATLNLADAFLSVTPGETDQTLKIGSGITVQGYGHLLHGSKATLENAGLIHANTADKLLLIQNDVFNNSGTLKVSQGNLHLHPQTWSNSGSLQQSGGELNLYFATSAANFGNFSRSGGTLNVYGSFDNSGQTLDIGAGGIFGVGGVNLSGKIQGGTIKSSDASKLNINYGTLAGVTLGGELHMEGVALVENNLILAQGAQLFMGDSRLYFTGTEAQHLSSSGSAKVIMNGGEIYADFANKGQTLYIDSGVSIQGHGGIGSLNSGNLVNAGMLEASDKGQTLSIHAPTISNSGTLRASNGASMYVDGLGSNAGTISLAGNSILQSAGKDLINNGRIEGSGSLQLSGGSLTNNGVLAPGGDAMVGKLTIDGNLQQGSGGSMQFEVGPAANNSDAIEVSGSLGLNGSLNVAAINGYTPQAGDKIGLMTYSGSPSGNFAATQAAAFPSATLDVATAGKMVLMMPSSFLNVWNFDGSGNWDDPSKWSLGHVPLAHEDVQVPDYSSQFTLNIGSNAHTVKSVVFLGNDKLAMSGGSLNLVNNSSLQYGVLDMNGSGILNLGGDLLLDQLNLAGSAQINLGSGKNLNVQHYLQSGGSLSGAGNLLIQQAYSRSAGTIGSDLSSLHITQKNGNLLPGKLDVNGPMSLHAENGDIRLTESVSVSGKNSMMLEASGKISQSKGTVSAEFLSMAAGGGIGFEGELNPLLQIKAGHLQAKVGGGGDLAVINKSGANLELLDIGNYGYALKNTGKGFIQVFNDGASLTIADSLIAENGPMFLGAKDVHFSGSDPISLLAKFRLLIETGGNMVLPANVNLQVSGDDYSTVIFLQADNLQVDGSMQVNSLSNGKAAIQLRADTLQLGSTANLQAPVVSLGVNSPGRPITLGSATCVSAPCLALSNLDGIQANTLHIGDSYIFSNSVHIEELGNTANKASLLHPSVQNLSLFSQGDITQTNPLTIPNMQLEAKGNINLNAPNQVSALTAKVDGSISFKTSQPLLVGTTEDYGIKAGGDIHLQSGNLQVAKSLDAGAHNISLVSSGQIGGDGLVKAGAVTLQAQNGIELDTETGKISASNLTNDIRLANQGVLEVHNLTQGGSGKIVLENKGKMVVMGPVSSDTGDISLVAHSPLQIEGSVSSTGGGAITLVASANGGTDDVLSVGPSAVIQSNGKVVLKAGNEIQIANGSSLSQNLVLQANLNLPPPTLPSLNDCISNPALSGCSSVLPDLQTCTANPAAPGCMVVLPNLATCVSAPATPGCSVVLPNLATCVSNPAAPGCSVVLPTLATCMASPALPGCSVVLPSIALCTSNPTAQGCSVVLPNLASCISNPTTPGCSAVLPSLTSCMAAPATPGCNVVLPDLAACISNPSTPACAVVLPTLATCSLNPATPGCSAVLPSLSMCTQSPSLPGCSAVLPNLSTCIANPASPGCNVILPTLASCTVNPATPGCSVVLPNIAACMSNPSLPGCTVVLPSLASCISSPSLPGCGAILPSLASCIATPASAGCNVVLPSVASCSADPALPGCSVVLPQVNVCITNPNAEGCKALPNETTQTLSEAVLSTNNLVTTNSNTASGGALLAGNNTDTGIKTANTENSSNNSSSNADSNTGNTGTVTVAGSEEKKSGSDTETKKEEKKEEKKAETAKKEPEKKEEPARKLYCN